VGATGFEKPVGPAETSRDDGETRREGQEVRATGDGSRGPVDALATALKLAAEAGQWEVVSTLARQLEAMRREEPPGLKLVRK